MNMTMSMILGNFLNFGSLSADVDTGAAAMLGGLKLILSFIYSITPSENILTILIVLFCSIAVSILSYILYSRGADKIIRQIGRIGTGALAGIGGVDSILNVYDRYQASGSSGGDSGGNSEDKDKDNDKDKDKDKDKKNNTDNENNKNKPNDSKDGSKDVSSQADTPSSNNVSSDK
jgi:hypothetical protein